MTVTHDPAEPALPRPSPADKPGPLDTAFYDLVETRFRRLIRDDPVAATYFGIHDYDDQLGDGGRETILAEIVADREHLAAIEALDDDGLSPTVRFERDLEVHNVRRSLFEADELRIWERRSLALDTIGDGLFLLFARDHAPLAERFAAITSRLEAVPQHLEEAKRRSDLPQVRLWQRIELESAGQLPAFFDELVAAGRGVLGPAEQRRLDRAVSTAGVAVDLYTTWLEGTLDNGIDASGVGRELHDRLVELRAFDGLDADEILALGEQKLAEETEARRAAAREIDPDADVTEVVSRVKEDHAATFDEALDSYREAMRRARAYLIEHDLATIPDDERIDVIETPDYLRNVIPFAAYFSPAAFERGSKGIYVVTPSIHGDPNAMREHNRASISNTSIHEAYPGHHLQLDMARRHPSLTRLLADAPEFVEGWGMYSELLMREQGFDDGPEYRVMLHTDAIWRACRIILDIRLHRGEIAVNEAIDLLVEQTHFERDNARSEVEWFTYRPTHPLPYLLGRTLLLDLRASEQRRLGDEFSIRDFHDTLLRNGSLPISFHRRLLAGEGV
ncbi:MAG TPA: DUF885 domain-containing protein [Candidatus Limnocylindrales bacterium]|nr:DUF885 domain-containing protein [Candidatus Limnocylindrales bacterium]